MGWSSKELRSRYERRVALRIRAEIDPKKDRRERAKMWPRNHPWRNWPTVPKAQQRKKR